MIPFDSTPAQPAYAGLELLTTSVLLLDHQLQLQYANPAAQSLFAFSLKNAVHLPLQKWLAPSSALIALLKQSITDNSGFNENELTVHLAQGGVLHLACVATPIEGDKLILECQALDQHIRITREEKILEHQQLNRDLIRNLAHEIKNPLGGIRGAAQLLETELPSRDLREYTGVIVKEADRLQALMDRMLTPHRIPKMGHSNIHELLERVRTLILAEFPQHIVIRRDYDVSLPDLYGDAEALIQALLNVTRNAAQAMNGKGEIRLVTRIARQVTLARTRHRQAILVHIIDNGPGVPESMRDHVFYPLVSGREGGTGLGLSLAQNIVNLHRGIIEFESEPGRTCFSIFLPLLDAPAA